VCHAILGRQHHARGRPAVVDAQSLQGVAHMVGDRVVGEAQLLADLLAGQMLPDQQQDFALAGRQPLEPVVSPVVLPVHLDNPTPSPVRGWWSTAGSVAAPNYPWL
jgi:hypothetical protein